MPFHTSRSVSQSAQGSGRLPASRKCARPEALGATRPSRRRRFVRKPVPTHEARPQPPCHAGKAERVPARSAHTPAEQRGTVLRQAEQSGGTYQLRAVLKVPVLSRPSAVPAVPVVPVLSRPERYRKYLVLSRPERYRCSTKPETAP